MKLDLLAIAAHPDDVELTCGGTLLKMAQKGYKTGILDLTEGEMGTRGTRETRAREAARAAKILKVSWRGTLGVPDSDVQSTRQHKLRLARAIRRTNPDFAWAAATAVGRWQFTAPTVKGRPVDVLVSIPMNYEPAAARQTEAVSAKTAAPTT